MPLLEITDLEAFYGKARSLHGVSLKVERHTTSKVRHVGGEVIRRLLINHSVLHRRSSLYSPDCFKTLFQVPGGKSSVIAPAMFINPTFKGCLYCRWLPLVRSKNQPSRWIKRMASLTLGTLQPRSPGPVYSDYLPGYHSSLQISWPFSYPEARLTQITPVNANSRSPSASYPTRP